LRGGERPSTKQSEQLRINICVHGPPHLSASRADGQPLKEEEPGFQLPETPDVVNINVGLGENWRPASEVSYWVVSGLRHWRLVAILADTIRHIELRLIQMRPAPSRSTSAEFLEGCWRASSLFLLAADGRGRFHLRCRERRRRNGRLNFRLLVLPLFVIAPLLSFFFGVTTVVWRTRARRCRLRAASLVPGEQHTDNCT
jgi:hypothetical protein